MFQDEAYKAIDGVVEDVPRRAFVVGTGLAGLSVGVEMSFLCLDSVVVAGVADDDLYAEGISVACESVNKLVETLGFTFLEPTFAKAHHDFFSVEIVRKVLGKILMLLGAEVHVDSVINDLSTPDPTSQYHTASFTSSSGDNRTITYNILHLATQSIANYPPHTKSVPLQLTTNSGVGVLFAFATEKGDVLKIGVSASQARKQMENSKLMVESFYQFPTESAVSFLITIADRNLHDSPIFKDSTLQPNSALVDPTNIDEITINNLIDHVRAIFDIPVERQLLTHRTPNGSMETVILRDLSTLTLYFHSLRVQTTPAEDGTTHPLIITLSGAALAQVDLTTPASWGRVLTSDVRNVRCAIRDLGCVQRWAERKDVVILGMNMGIGGLEGEYRVAALLYADTVATNDVKITAARAAGAQEAAAQYAAEKALLQTQVDKAENEKREVEEIYVERDGELVEERKKYAELEERFAAMGMEKTRSSEENIKLREENIKLRDQLRAVEGRVEEAAAERIEKVRREEEQEKRLLKAAALQYQDTASQMGTAMKRMLDSSKQAHTQMGAGLDIVQGVYDRFSAILPRANQAVVGVPGTAGSASGGMAGKGKGSNVLGLGMGNVEWPQEGGRSVPTEISAGSSSGSGEAAVRPLILDVGVREVAREEGKVPAE
ncbi:hypothetical protein HDV00_006089 [Rhizophlyctis rosea]|nr:hypothetical protein HDV00_006089 [Rhizophlyctis rosea]